MEKYCCVVGCKSNSAKEKLSFYKFPKEVSCTPRFKYALEEFKKINKFSVKRQKLWIQAIKRSDINLKNATVCQHHFISGLLYSIVVFFEGSASNLLL